VRKMRELVHGGELGALRMISTWHFNEFMYRPRMPQELDAARGGNIVYNQGPHQLDIVRLIGGGLVRSVRAMTGIWDPARRAEGAYCAYLEFEDGTPATLAYNGYGHFDTAEFSEWVGEQQRDPDYNLRMRRQLSGAKTPEDEWALKEAQRFLEGPLILGRLGAAELAAHAEVVVGVALLLPDPFAELGGVEMPVAVVGQCGRRAVLEFEVG